jgi:hypothetical protein
LIETEKIFARVVGHGRYQVGYASLVRYLNEQKKEQQK